LRCVGDDIIWGLICDDGLNGCAEYCRDPVADIPEVTYIVGPLVAKTASTLFDVDRLTEDKIEDMIGLIAYNESL
jgi:hypothetical protein